MELDQAIAERKSIRAFTDRPVPRGIITRVLEKAVRAPSALNLQPWEFTVVLGEEKERLSRALIKAYRERMISCSPEAKGPLPDVLGKRGAASFQAMQPALEAMGVAFDEFINEGSCRFYDAPVAVIVCMNKVFSHRRYLCVGAALGYLVLAAHAEGLGTCPIGLVSAYEDTIRECINIPEDRELAVAVAMGYPDWNSPINRFVTPRAPVDDVLRWFD